MQENTNPELTDKTPAPTGYYSDKSRKKRDFWISFVGSILGNLVLFGLYMLVADFLQIPGLHNPSVPTQIAIAVVALLPWVLNIAAIIVSLIKGRTYITLGILASYGAALALTILAGIVMTIWCIVSGSTL